MYQKVSTLRTINTGQQWITFHISPLLVHISILTNRILLRLILVLRQNVLDMNFEATFTLITKIHIVHHQIKDILQIQLYEIILVIVKTKNVAIICNRHFFLLYTLSGKCAKNFRNASYWAINKNPTKVDVTCFWNFLYVPFSSWNL